MDINDFRSLSTVFVMIAFFGICWWAFSPSRSKKFDDAANLPFADEGNHERSIK
ncbi:MAG: cytochrome c oxidase cbb3-type subunit 4 [Candidatus Endobugula sp.]|jgi:cytochrome c oxidase cbb3-type subunit 4